MKKLKTQKDHYSCVPVAIYNALNLLKIKNPGLKKLSKMCKTNRTGTYLRDKLSCLTKLNLKFNKANKTDNKSVYIYSYITKDDGSGHCVIYFKNKTYNYWNGSRYIKASKQNVNNKFDIYKIGD